MFAFGVCLYVAFSILHYYIFFEHVLIHVTSLRYILLGGSPPFSCVDCRARGVNPCRCGRVNRHVRRGYRIDGGGWRFTPAFDHVTEEAKELVKSLLEVHPQNRPTAAQCLAHPWFKKSLSASGTCAGPSMGGGIASTILSFFPGDPSTDKHDRSLNPGDLAAVQRRRRGGVGGWWVGWWLSLGYDSNLFDR